MFRLMINSLVITSSLVIFVQNGLASEPCKGYLGILEIPKLFGAVANSGDVPPGQNGPQKGSVVKGSRDLNNKESVLLKQASEVSSAEFGYELKGAIVCKRSKDRFGIRDIRGNIIWISDAGPFHSYFELVKDGLTYLPENWDGKLWPEAGKGKTSLLKAPKHKNVRLAIKVEEEKIIAEERWFRILILPEEVCSVEKQNIQGSGWIPAHEKDGKPLVHYSPRGC